MRILTCLLVFISLISTGCSSSIQGIKIRAQAPSIEEAYRKLSLALSVDGYETQEVNPAAFTLETAWRALKEKEKSEADLRLAPGAVESKITLRCERRGGLFDIFLTPMLRYRDGGTIREMPAGARHPLLEKWQRALNSLVTREFKEED